MSSDTPSGPADRPYLPQGMGRPGETLFSAVSVPTKPVRLSVEQEAFRRRAVLALGAPNSPQAVKAALGSVILGGAAEGARVEALGIPELHAAAVEGLYRDMLDAPAGAAHIVEMKSGTSVVMSENGSDILPIRFRHPTAVLLKALNDLHRSADTGVHVSARIEALGDVETRSSMLAAFDQGAALAEAKQERAAEQVMEPSPTPSARQSDLRL